MRNSVRNVSADARYIVRPDDCGVTEEDEEGRRMKMEDWAVVR